MMSMRRDRTIAVASCLALVVVLAASCVRSGFYAVATEEDVGRALTLGDLQYLGAFRTPAGAFGTDENAVFAYSDQGLAYNPVNDSLIIKGHAYGQLVAEISTPTPVSSTTLDDLPIASVLQGFADATDGHREDEHLDQGASLRGLLVIDSLGQSLLVGAVSGNADFAHSQRRSHFTSSLDLDAVADFRGLFTVGDAFPGLVGGAMAAISPTWQAALGGSALTGQCCAGNAEQVSHGPAAWIFDPTALSDTGAAPATGVVYYPAEHPTLGRWDNTTEAHPDYNMTTRVAGIVFPLGSSSVLFVGVTGLGVPCAGRGTDDASLHGQATGSGDVYCYDPANPYSGGHAYPYTPYVWIYEARDLVAVKQGEMLPWEPVPVATGALTLPFTGSGINGVAYDTATNRIFVAQAQADQARPVIHVFTIDD